MGALYLLNAAMSYGYSRIMVRISQKTVAQLRQDLFNKMQTGGGSRGHWGRDGLRHDFFQPFSCTPSC